MVGSVVEPNVFLGQGIINFGPLLIGGKNVEKVSMHNIEKIPIQFNFDRESIKGDPEYLNSLKVEPLSGVIPAEGEVPIQITFEPKVQTEFNYNINCQVKRKSRPVCINVKGIGYILSHSVRLGDAPASLSHLDPVDLDFGSIFVNEKKMKTLFIENNGDFNFDFTFKKAPSSFIKVIPEFGSVRKGDTFKIEVSFIPMSETVIERNALLSLVIISGPTYRFRVKGAAKRPGIDFSFLNYDFGSCFVMKQPLPITAHL